MYQRAALGGTVGIGEAWMDGWWDCSDLTTLVRIFVRNRQLLDRLEGGLARLGAALLRTRSKTQGGVLQGVANAAGQPVAPLTVLASRILPTT